MKSKIITIENNWNNYRDFFPDRYWKIGDVDTFFLKKINELNIEKENLLDVGGGALGTEILKNMFKKHILLDPNITNIPNYINKNVTFQELKANKEKFNLIVARGSINYLNELEIKQLKSLIDEKGLIIFNTFCEPPSEDWNKKIYETDGVKIEESARFNKEKNIVEHELITNNKKIVHTFNYYSEVHLKTLLGDNLENFKYGKNSVVYYLKNN